MSFNIGVSGLKAAAKDLEVISQNIANVNTAGYKEERAEFAAVYSGGDPGGVEVSRVSQNFARDGGKQFTGRELDVAISDRGFFMTRAQNGDVTYTRAGQFSRDADNYIVTADQSRLQGYQANAVGELQEGAVTDLRLGVSSIPANASTQLEFVANFKADSPAIPAVPAFDPANADTYNYTYSSTVYDSLGTARTMTQYMVNNSPNNWTVHQYIDGNPVASTNLTFNPDGTLASPSAPVTITHTPTGADPMNIALDFSGTTQYSGNFSVARNETDGYPAGEASGLRVDDDGKIYSLYTNGRDLLMGQMVLANFSNPDAMERLNGTAWRATFDSGMPIVGKPGIGSLGTLTSGAYEESNVDLTDQLVDMVSAQRNYQANAKTISTANEANQVLLQSV